MAVELGDTLRSALQQRLDVEYRRGLEDGLRVADKIIGWLSRTPDTQRQAEVRSWAERAVERARTVSETDIDATVQFADNFAE